MRGRDYLLDLARKCFEDAADCEDPAQMKLHADMGRRYLEEAEAAEATAPAKPGNGNQGEI